MISTVTTRLKKSKAHRDAFVASEIKVGLPFQIRALRKQRGWNQKQLADLAGMLQPRISAMEQPGGGQLNLETLRKLASAFDVGLLVKFVPFSELAKWSDDFSPDDFAVLSFAQESEKSIEPGSLETVLRLVSSSTTGAVTEPVAKSENFLYNTANSTRLNRAA